MSDVQGQPQAHPHSGNGQDQINTLNEMAADCDALARALSTFAANLRARGSLLANSLEATATKVLDVIGR